MYENFNDFNKNNAIDLEPSASKKKNKTAKVIAFVLSVAIIGGASGFGGAYLSNTMFDNSDIVSNTVSPSEHSYQTTEENSSAENNVTHLVNNPTSAETLTTKEIVKKMTPSVVLVSSEFSNGSGTGTGIVMSKDGYIITNAHVIESEVTKYDGPSGDVFGFWSFGGGSYSTTMEKSSKITVTLSDDSEYEAKIIGSDTNSDLAVLKIEANNLTPAEFGESTSLEMGDKAVAIGYPAGLGLSTSEGIVSGLDRDISFETKTGGKATMTLIQTDAAINPGNSGGPLVNQNGQVIGITSSKLVDSSIEGLGFAIPISDAVPLIDELMDNGYIVDKTPTIGITGTDITTASQRYYDLPVSSGVMIISVDSGSGAANAGLSEGDIIIKADGKKVETMDELISIKNKHKAGDTMTLTLARKDGDVDINIVLDTKSE